MPENFNFATEADDLLRRAMEVFAAWAAENWTMTPGEAETLTEPTENCAARAALRDLEGGNG